MYAQVKYVSSSLSPLSLTFVMASWENFLSFVEVSLSFKMVLRINQFLFKITGNIHHFPRQFQFFKLLFPFVLASSEGSTFYCCHIS